MTSTIADPAGPPVPDTTGAPTAAGPHRWNGSSLPVQIAVLTRRSLLAVATNPRILVFSLLQPLIMLTLFSQVFSGISTLASFPEGINYIDYLMPAILVTTAAASGLQSGSGFVEDMKNGVLARFRSLPIQTISVLIARSASDLVRTGVQLLVMLGVAIALFGFTPHGGVSGLAGAYGLALLVGWGLSWIFLALGVWLQNGEAMQMVGFLAFFPLMFASSAYVPVESMPDWLGVVATVNPLSYAIDASRNLALSFPVGPEVAYSIMISLIIAVIGMTTAARLFRRRA